MAELRAGTYVFHGAGSANVGAAALLMNEAGVPKSRIFMTNSRGIIWVSSPDCPSYARPGHHSPSGDR